MQITGNGSPPAMTCYDLNQAQGRKCNYGRANPKDKRGRRRPEVESLRINASSGGTSNAQDSVADQKGEPGVSEPSGLAGATTSKAINPRYVKSNQGQDPSMSTDRKEPCTTSSLSYLDGSREPIPTCTCSNQQLATPKVAHLPDHHSLDDASTNTEESSMVACRDANASLMSLFSPTDISPPITDIEPLSVGWSASSSPVVHTNDSFLSLWSMPSEAESPSKILELASKTEIRGLEPRPGPELATFTDLTSPSLESESISPPGPEPEPPTLVLPGSHDPSFSRSPADTMCQGLEGLFILMDKLGSVADNDITSLDGALAIHKEGLSYGVRMAGCEAYTTKLENMMILTFMIHMLTRICRCINAACASNKASSRRHSVIFDLGEVDRSGDPQVASNIQVGIYHVDSPDEYAAIVGGLLQHQLRLLIQLIHHLHIIAERLESGLINSRLAVSNKASTAILRELRPEAAQ
ncbi:putative Zn(2)-C6 fungal-type domain-containing protein [Seiridium unicorne]|uniref:Zn(2)-C6 fungal-type domain-containing protein n=1 Tax=Seiridium unicorne TaxID=138068 RepID=A0ABR2UIW4_9PEZI